MFIHGSETKISSKPGCLIVETKGPKGLVHERQSSSWGGVLL